MWRKQDLRSLKRGEARVLADVAVVTDQDADATAERCIEDGVFIALSPGRWLNCTDAALMSFMVSCLGLCTRGGRRDQSVGGHDSQLAA